MMSDFYPRASAAIANFFTANALDDRGGPYKRNISAAVMRRIFSLVSAFAPRSFRGHPRASAGMSLSHQLSQHTHRQSGRVSYE